VDAELTAVPDITASEACDVIDDEEGLPPVALLSTSVPDPETNSDGSRVDAPALPPGTAGPVVGVEIEVGDGRMPIVPDPLVSDCDCTLPPPFASLVGCAVSVGSSLDPVVY
jgi:hypothetical protein